MHRSKVFDNIIMLTVLVVFILSITLFARMRNVQASESVHYDKHFVTVEIHNGDTLTSLAHEYYIPNKDCADYIAEVKSMNNMKEDTIHAGCYLVVPVYEECIE